MERRRVEMAFRRMRTEGAEHRGQIEITICECPSAGAQPGGATFGVDPRGGTVLTDRVWSWDVAQDAIGVSYGALLDGARELHVSDLSVQEVPLTDGARD